MSRYIFEQQTRAAIFSAFVVLAASISISAQSSLQDHPTPIVRNEIEGTIKARDVGDSRLTTHYYWFDGGQGDVFINWTSTNFAGDVDLFVQNGLRSLSKIVVYADFGQVETGRVIYLRKPERLLLRVQGRTPNDDAATYRLKFAGSFIAATASEKDPPAIPTVGESVTGAVRVNSVGTILPQAPKPVETKTEEEKAAETAATLEKAAADKSESEKQAETRSATVEDKKETPKLEVVVEDAVKKADSTKSTTARRPPRKTRPARTAAAKTTAAKADDESSAAANDDAETAKSETRDGDPLSTDTKRSVEDNAAVVTPKTTVKVDPLANVQLVILFKDGRKIERPLPEVFRFSVDRGVLTVVSKDGRVGKYQMLDVAKVTIE